MDNTILFYIMIFVLFGAMIYFLMYRPRKKQEEQRRKVMDELKKGDRVMTIGGIHGQIESISEDTVILKVESGVTLRMSKGAIAGKPEEIATRRR